MISIANIKQQILRKLFRSSGLPDTAIIHPGREWNVGVIVFLVVVMIGSIGAWLAYKHYGTINLGSDVGITEKLNYKRSDALAALEVYATREAVYQGLLAAAPEEPSEEVADPALPNDTAELIEAGLLGTDGQILPQLPEEVPVEESEAPPTLDISE